MNKLKLILLAFIIFSILFCSKETKSESPENSEISMIMLQSDFLITEEALNTQLIDDWGNEYKIDSYAEEEQTAVFNLNDNICSIIYLAEQIPEEELEFPVQTELYWENASEEINKHAGHLVVYVSSGNSKLAVAVLLTKLTSSLLKITDSIGVYWGSSAQVINKEFFSYYSDMLKQDTIPTPLWVKTTGYLNKDNTFYLYTIGLADLGHREFEISHFPGDFSEGIFFLLDLSDYVLSKGAIIKDGDTVGSTATEKIRVRYKYSDLHPDTEVISILY